MTRSEIEFDKDGLVARVAKASADILRRVGAYVRAVARRKVKTSKNPSPPGSPPHSRWADDGLLPLRGKDRKGLLLYTYRRWIPG